MKVPAVFAALAGVSATQVDTNPLAKVLDLMDECSAKVKSDMEAEAKAYKEYFEWCDDVAKNVQFEIKTAKSSQEKLTAAITKLTSDIEVGTSKIEDLSASIATNEADLKEATAVREKEAADFAAAEAEMVDAVDTLGRAIGILERELAKNPAAFAQIDTTNMAKLTQAIGTVIDAAAFSGQDKSKLMALIQSNDNDDDDEGAPDPAAYKSHSGGILDVLGDMKDKAEGELADLRKAETNAKQNFNMLKGSLEGEIAADNKDLDEEKSGKAANEEEKATSEGELAQTEKDLANAEANMAETTHGCLTAAADHESNVANANEELKVIAEAKKILQETTAGAVSQSYGFLQLAVSSKLKTRADLVKSEIITVVKNLARNQHSAALAQLSSRIEAVMQYGNMNGADVFEKIKGLIQDMITKLEKEAEEDAAEKAYCDEEMSKTEAKKQQLDSDIEALTTKIDRAASKSASLKEEVKEAQAELAAVAKEQAEMDKLRQEQNADYKVAKADLELGLGGVQKALEKLREYYGGAAAALVQDDQHFGNFMQQPAPPPAHQKSTGAGQSIIGILEVCESDFSKNLASEEQAESDAVEEYEKTTQENKITKTTKDQDVKYKTQEFKSLDKEITELSSDKDTASVELSAVMEYYAKIKERCVAKPETYEERKKRREAEIEGLKEALTILDNETAFVQRRKRPHMRGALQ